MGTRKLTFSVFKINPITLDVKSFIAAEQFKVCLEKPKSIKDRMMSVSDEDDKDRDFVSSFKYEDNGLLFGTFLRFREGSESSLSIDDLEKKEIEINEFIKESPDNSAGSLSDLAFFAIQDNYLVLTRAHSNRKALLNYMRWLAERYNFSSLFEFDPVYNTANEIPIKDIKRIKLADVYLSSEFSSEMIQLKNKIIKSFLSDSLTPTAYDWEDIASATLVVKIKKDELKKQKALNTVMNLVDNEDVIIEGRNGKRIKGSDYQVRTVRDIQSDRNKLFNIPEIELVMQEIINDVKAGKVVN